ncbi:MAG: hypothetical protein Q8P10_01420 [bacterium]|nr:hypothetical protein [bacterium]
MPAEVEGFSINQTTTAQERPVSVTVLISTGQRLMGGLNNNYILADPEGRFYVWRVPKRRIKIFGEIEEELRQTGFLDSGGIYGFRKPMEQVQFMEETSRLGLKNHAPLYTDGHGILLPYIEGILLDQYLSRGNMNATFQVLENLSLAHSMGVVYGDRWVKNTIVTEREDVVEIDFDMKLGGKYAKEFEMAQILYHLLHFSSDRRNVLNFLKGYLKSKKLSESYDVSALCLFLFGYMKYFEGKEYEEKIGGREEILDLIKMVTTS